MYYEHAKGVESENRVIKELMSQGWQVLHHRYKTKLAEIDIIFKKQNHIRLIEVKSISNWDFVNYRVSKKQKIRLQRAFLYLQSHYKGEMTLELALVAIGGEILFIEIENNC